MPDRMPEDMPEHMPDRMPEDLPVRKCINVMVGITRSKVFFFGLPWERFQDFRQCSQPDPNSNLWIKVFPAGPPPQAPDQTVPPCRASAASS